MHADYPLDAAAVLLVEADGTPEEVAAEMAEITRVLAAAGATAIRVSKDEAQRLLFWSGRKAAFPAVGRISPDYYCIDGTIPRRALPHVLRQIEALSQRVRAALRQRVPRRRRQPASADPVRRQRRRARWSAPRRSAPRSSSCASRSAARSPASTASASRSCRRCACSSGAPSSSAFSRIKAAFDSASRCSIPGKGVPTLSRCAEFGKMHVHHGKLPHPELPRF